MAKGDVALVAGLAGFLLAGVAVYLAGTATREVDGLKKGLHDTGMADSETLAALGEKVAALDRGLAATQSRLNADDGAPGSRGDRIRQLEERIAALEAARGGGGEPATPVLPSGPKALDPNDALAFSILQEKVFSGEATPDEQAAFWALLREKPEILASAIAKLESRVNDAPHDHDARMQLSRAYVAKIFTVPAGPEQGVWSRKAMGQYEKILADDPNHWEARYSLAFNYSQWPDFLNKRPDAIREFETLRKQQESAVPEPKHAQTYLQLRNLYLKDGKTDDAKAMLDEGLRRFPDDAELKKAAGK